MLPPYVLNLVHVDWFWVNATAVNEATNTQAMRQPFTKTSCGRTRLILVPRTGSLVQTVVPLI